VSEKIIDEFEEMIEDVCGEKPNIRLPDKHRPTPDFYDIYHEEFMKWWEERKEEKYHMKMHVKCPCGEKYVVYSEPDRVEDFVTWSETGTSTSNSYYSFNQHVSHERFFCYKCGKPFSVTGSKIVKIKSNQLEVVL